MGEAGVRSPRELLARLPRVQFGTGERRESVSSPVLTYYLIVVPALVLSVFGLLMGFSASTVTNIASGANPYVAFLRPLAIIVFSLLIASLVQFVPERRWQRVALWILPVALVVQALVITPLGSTSGGNRNWIHMPGLAGLLLQPSELLKLALALFLGHALTRPGARLRDWKQMAVTVGIPILAALGAVMLGRDLGTALVVAACAIGALWVAGLSGRWFAGLGIAMVPVLVFFVVQNPTRLKRILDILPGHSTPSITAPTQSDHALWALGSGGLWGLGPGASREKWQYLQAAHTDFILAIIGEEFGLLGAITVLICLGLMVWGMIRVCQHSVSRFVQVVAGGVATWVAVQSLLNTMSVIGLGPVIGVPLPLVSYGGSSFLFTACAVAVVAAFAREEAGMRMIGKPDEASAGRDPRRAPRRRRADGTRGVRGSATRTTARLRRFSPVETGLTARRPHPFPEARS